MDGVTDVPLAATCKAAFMSHLAYLIHINALVDPASGKVCV